MPADVTAEAPGVVAPGTGPPLRSQRVAPSGPQPQASHKPARQQPSAAPTLPQYAWPPHGAGTSHQQSTDRLPSGKRSSQWNKLTVSTQPIKRRQSAQAQASVGAPVEKILLMCAGPDDREQSITKLLKHAGYGVRNYDIANGPDVNDLADTAVFDQIMHDIDAGDYVGGFASPPCNTYTKARNKPGGPKPLRGPRGRDRIGFKTKKGVPCYKDGSPLSTSEAQNLKKHTLIAVRVAAILARLHACGIPFGYETPQRCENQASMLHHDEYVSLLALPGVKHKVGVQCSFGAESS